MTGQENKIKINEHLNLVISLESGRGYVHCPPLNNEGFVSCWKLLAKTWSYLETGDISITAGGAVAALVVEDIVKNASEDEAILLKEQASTLFNTIRRNATYIGISQNGDFNPIPWNSAIKKGVVEDEEILEVNNALVFFIVGSAILPKKRKNIILGLLASLRDVSLTSSDAITHIDSLQKSTEEENTGETAGE